MLINKKNEKKNLKSMTDKKEDKTKQKHARQKQVENKNSWSRQVYQVKISYYHKYIRNK